MYVNRHTVRQWCLKVVTPSILRQNQEAKLLTINANIFYSGMFNHYLAFPSLTSSGKLDLLWMFSTSICHDVLNSLLSNVAYYIEQHLFLVSVNPCFLKKLSIIQFIRCIVFPFPLLVGLIEACSFPLPSFSSFYCNIDNNEKGFTVCESSSCSKIHLQKLHHQRDSCLLGILWYIHTILLISGKIHYR